MCGCYRTMIRWVSCVTLSNMEEHSESLRFIVLNISCVHFIYISQEFICISFMHNSLSLSLCLSLCVSVSVSLSLLNACSLCLRTCIVLQVYDSHAGVHGVHVLSQFVCLSLCLCLSQSVCSPSPASLSLSLSFSPPPLSPLLYTSLPLSPSYFKLSTCSQYLNTCIVLQVHDGHAGVHGVHVLLADELCGGAGSDDAGRRLRLLLLGPRQGRRHPGPASPVFTGPLLQVWWCLCGCVCVCVLL